MLDYCLLELDLTCGAEKECNTCFSEIFFFVRSSFFELHNTAHFHKVQAAIDYFKGGDCFINFTGLECCLNYQ